MNLTTASKPEKKTVSRSIEKCVKQARYKDDVLLPPVFDTAEILVDIWVVETSYEGKIETHEFDSKSDAERYFEGFK